MLDTYTKDKTQVSVVVTTQAALDRQAADSSLSMHDISRRFILNEYEDKDEFMAAVNSYVTDVLGDTSEDREIKYLEPFYRYVSSTAPDSSFDFGFITTDAIDEDVWALIDLDEDDLGIFLAWYKLYEMSDDGVELTLHQAKRYHIGWFDSVETFARSRLAISGELDTIPEYIAECIDFDLLGNNMLTGDIKEANNHYFNNY